MQMHMGAHRSRAIYIRQWTGWLAGWPSWTGPRLTRTPHGFIYINYIVRFGEQRTVCAHANAIKKSNVHASAITAFGSYVLVDAATDAISYAAGQSSPRQKLACVCTYVQAHAYDFTAGMGFEYKCTRHDFIKKFGSLYRI